MTQTLSVLTTFENNVMTITMNRPESLNSANEAMLLEMQDALRTANHDQAVRCVVITGAGRGFCSGADLRENPSITDFKAHLDKTFNPLMRLMRKLEKPVITAVNGIAAGAGASIALGGDIRVWSSDASFTQAFSKIALIPDAGSSWLLPRLVGYNRAFDLMTHATMINAEEGFRLGLCERVYAAAEFMIKVKNLAENLASGPTKTFGLTKRALNNAMQSSFEEQLECEAQLQQIAGSSVDFREGVEAFLEKRTANFEGK